MYVSSNPLTFQPKANHGPKAHKALRTWCVPLQSCLYFGFTTDTKGLCLGQKSPKTSLNLFKIVPMLQPWSLLFKFSTLYGLLPMNGYNSIGMYINALMEETANKL